MDYKKSIRTILSNRSVGFDNQINAIKEKISAGDYKLAIKSHPAFSKILNRNPFFKTLKDIYIRDPYFFTKNFKKEYRWTSDILEGYFSEIDTFIKLKNSFEIKIILEDYKEATNILNEVEKLFGISLWSIEAHLIVEEKVNGSESNWNKLSFYLTEIKSSIYDFIISSNSKRIEAKLSYESYLTQFQNDINAINGDGIIEDFFIFKNFSVAVNEYEYPKLESVIYASNIFSIIDQYLILMDVIIYNVAESNVDAKLFFPFINKAKEVITNDSRLLNIYNLINDEKKIIKHANNELIFSCLNYYYSGNFESALNNAKKGVLEFPNEYEYYEIYCKALINLKSDFISLNVSSLSDQILKDTFDLLSFRKDAENSWTKLLKTSLFFMNTNMGKQIFGLIAEIEGKNKREFGIGVISSTFNSHKNIFLAESREIIIENFKELLVHNSFNVQLYKLGYDVEFDESFFKSTSQVKMLRAIRYFNLGRFAEVIELLSPKVEFNDPSETPYYLERKISLLYYSFLKENLLKEALILYVKMFFDDSIITRKLDHYKIFDLIRKSAEKDSFVSLIEYPILFSFINKEYDLYEAYDDFMYANDFDNIKELDIDQFIEVYSLDKVIYFLNNIATIDTLKYSVEYNSIYEVEEDRISILNHLILIDITKKLDYEKEINDIYRINSVRKVLKEVDEGRLYIDIISLKEMQIKKSQDDYKRFKEIELFSTNQALIGFNTSNAKNWEKALIEINVIDEKYNSADYLAFKNIYLECRENFLYSKEYGLDSCLSTRIRHGALKNHIRSVFEKLNLVTSKSNNRYKDNDHWNSQLNFDNEEINSEVQKILKEFSKEIDDYTAIIVDKLVQIRTEKTIDKSEAMFNFTTNDEILFKFYDKNKLLFTSIESTVDIILASLTNRTLLELQEDIVKYFTTEISARFVQFIDNKISAIRNLNIISDCQLLPYLIKSKTDIKNELESISNWYYLNTTSSTTLLSIQTIIDASVELTNKINPNYKIAPKINLKCQPFGLYSSMIFVFNILFNNIIQHSKLPFNKAEIKIDIDSIDKQYFQVTLSNKINTNTDYSNNFEKLNKIKSNWNDHSNIDRSNKEGESGFDKIKRILLYETYSKTDKFDFLIEDSNISIDLFFPYVKIDKDE